MIKNIKMAAALFFALAFQNFYAMEEAEAFELKCWDAQATLHVLERFSSSENDLIAAYKKITVREPGQIVNLSMLTGNNDYLKAAYLVANDQGKLALEDAIADTSMPETQKNLCKLFMYTAQGMRQDNLLAKPLLKKQVVTEPHAKHIALLYDEWKIVQQSSALQEEIYQSNIPGECMAGSDFFIDPLTSHSLLEK